MPELRQNLATKEWVIFSTERPQQPASLRVPVQAPPARDRSACPFCPGHETMTGPASLAIGDEPRWRVRCIPNKTPVLVPNAPKVGEAHKLYRALPGEGIHEIIVDSPDHDAELGSMPESQARDLFSAYQKRFQEALNNPRIAFTMIFKNHGPASGTSIEHPHSQLVGSGVVPHGIRHRMDEAMKYYESTGSCVFCRMIEAEMKDKARVVEENDHFVAFVLYAALSPFHLWILPKRHMASFNETNENELASLARIVQRVIRRLKAGLGGISYNYVIQSTPLDRGTTECFHWYMSLVVRCSKVSGFELGSGFYTNPVLPEESAKFLLGQQI
ncbi:MAG: DUF4931 domain-containing protein [Elusimicrobiota bacterium]